MQTYTTLKPIIYGTFIHLFVRIKVQHKLVSGFWTGVPVPNMTFFWIFRFFSNRLDLCFKLTECQKKYYQRKAWDISLQKTPILHILAHSLDGNRKKNLPLPHKKSPKLQKLHVSISLKATMNRNWPKIDCIRLVSSRERDFKQIWRSKMSFRSQKLRKMVILRDFRFSEKMTF